MTHQIVKPQFAYSDLEPYFDTQTMEIHTEKHHQAYADKLNAAIAVHSELQKASLVELLTTKLTDSPAILNPAGGVANHNFFWSILSPTPNQPIPKIFQPHITPFTAAATSLFGSGWTWLVKKNNSIEVINLPNQDSPLSLGLTPLLALDLWEHAYYLKYQNRRPEFIEGFWHLVNWQHVYQLYLETAQNVPFSSSSQS